MPSVTEDTRAAVIAATATSTTMIAYQMAAKATRDALFLSSFDVSALPAVVGASAVVSVALSVVAARLMTTRGPARIVPLVFVISAFLFLVEWGFVSTFRRPVAVIVYLQCGSVGALLVSGFWSIVTERFDPRTAKTQISRIATGATVGGLLGGLLAERMAVVLSVTAMLPILAVLQLLCAWLVSGLVPGGEDNRQRIVEPDASETATGWFGVRIIRDTPYLRNLVVLVVLATASEILIDYVFKARASARFGTGEDLLRLFGVFYTGVSLLTVVVQAGMGRMTLRRLGPARATAFLPSALAVGGVGALAWPGLASAVIARGAEAVVRNALYRPGYELLFTPVAKLQKRATKVLLDVGGVRLGDLAGAVLVQAALLMTVGNALPVLLSLAVFLSIAGGVVALRLHGGYAGTLEDSLLRRSSQFDEKEMEDVFETAVFQTMGTLQLAPVHESASTAASSDGDIHTHSAALERAADPDEQRIEDLQSRNADRVRRALKQGPLTASLLPAVVSLLAWDAVAADVIRSLRKVATSFTSLLVEPLLDQDEQFAVRRRIPLVLAASPNQRAVQGLVHGLGDRRFEVRYRCGRALSRLLELDPKLVVDRGTAIAAVLQEVAVDRRIWQSHRVIDHMDDDEWSPVMDELLRDRADRSLEHVFTILSLFLPREPLKIAFRGLNTGDPHLRGTALEYLETSLPASIRVQLWPFLEADRKSAGVRRSSDQILAELLQSRNSITINLEELRRKSQQG